MKTTGRNSAQICWVDGNLPLILTMHYLLYSVCVLLSHFQSNVEAAVSFSKQLHMSKRETYKSCVKSIEKRSLCVAANSYTNKYEGSEGALCCIVVLCAMKLMEGRWDLTFCILLHSTSKFIYLWY